MDQHLNDEAKRIAIMRLKSLMNTHKRLGNAYCVGVCSDALALIEQLQSELKQESNNAFLG